MPFLTDRLARVQLMESQGKATEVGSPHIAEAKAANTPRRSFSFVNGPCRICKSANGSPTPPCFSRDNVLYFCIYDNICNCENQVVLYSVAQSQNIILICCAFGRM